MDNHIKFDDIPISTSTIIGTCNCQLHIQNLFEQLKVITYKFRIRKRGRKRKDYIDITNHITLQDGDIIFAKYRNIMKGNSPNYPTSYSPIKTNHIENSTLSSSIENKINKNDTFFRNTLTIIMFYKSKFINFKIFSNKQSNGTKTQHPGIKSIEYIIEYMNLFFNRIFKYCLISDICYPSNKINKIWTNNNNCTKTISIIFETVMTNINFNLGFNVNRQKLDSFVNNKMNNKYNSMLESNFGHSAVNITFPIEYPFILEDLPLVTFDYSLSSSSSYTINYIPYNDFKSSLIDEKYLTKKNPIKYRKHTFLIFHSGNVIFSSYTKTLMEAPFHQMYDFLITNRESFEEKISI